MNTNLWSYLSKGGEWPVLGLAFTLCNVTASVIDGS